MGSSDGLGLACGYGTCVYVAERFGPPGQPMLMNPANVRLKRVKVGMLAVPEPRTNPTLMRESSVPR